MKENLPQLHPHSISQASTLIANAAGKTVNFRFSQPKTILSQSEVKGQRKE